MVEVQPAGYHVVCPTCERELRINRKYAGEGVQCKFCRGQFRLELDSPDINTVAFFADCPHCSEELRIAVKYLDMKVACKLCGGKIHFTAQA